MRGHPTTTYHGVLTRTAAVPAHCSPRAHPHTTNPPSLCMVFDRDGGRVDILPNVAHLVRVAQLTCAAHLAGFAHLAGVCIGSR